MREKANVNHCADVIYSVRDFPIGCDTNEYTTSSSLKYSNILLQCFTKLFKISTYMSFYSINEISGKCKISYVHIKDSGSKVLQRDWIGLHMDVMTFQFLACKVSSHPYFSLTPPSPLFDLCCLFHMVYHPFSCLLTPRASVMGQSFSWVCWYSIYPGGPCFFPLLRIINWPCKQTNKKPLSRAQWYISKIPPIRRQRQKDLTIKPSLTT